MALVKIVADTNVIVSGIAYPMSMPGRLLQAWRGGRLGLVVSRYLVDEVARVLPRLKHGEIDAEQARDIADTFFFLAELVVPTTPDEPTLRDDADAPILGTFLASDAMCLVTGDKDLLALAHRYPILSVRDFWERFGA